MAPTARKYTRSAVSTAGGRIESLLKAATVDKTQLHIALGQLEDKASRLWALDELWAHHYETDASRTEAEADEEAANTEQYRDNVSRWTTLARMALNRNVSEDQRSGPRINSENGSVNGTQNSAPGQGRAFRMPTYQLTKFDGRDFLQFPAWLDEFYSLVHRNENLEDVEKFALLKDSITGNAKMMIESLLKTEENYATALSTLEDMYGDPNLLLGLFVTRLHTLSGVNNPKSPQFQTLVLKFEHSYIAIMNLIRKLLKPRGERQAGSSTPSGSETGEQDDKVVSFFSRTASASEDPGRNPTSLVRQA